MIISQCGNRQEYDSFFPISRSAPPISKSIRRIGQGWVKLFDSQIITHTYIMTKTGMLYEWVITYYDTLPSQRWRGGDNLLRQGLQTLIHCPKDQHEVWIIFFSIFPFSHVSYIYIKNKNKKTGPARYFSVLCEKGKK